MEQFDDLLGDRQTHPVLDPAASCAEQTRGVEQEFAVLVGDVLGGAGEDAGAGLQVVGEVGGALTGVELLGDRRTPGGVRIAPGLDAIRPESDRVGGDERRVEGVRFG